MTTPSVNLSSGATFELPTFDPFVAAHVSSAHSYVGTLLDQINGGLYAPLFAGKRNLTFLDIGANIGLVSIYAAPACKRIVAVEPAPDTFRVLQAMTGKFPQIEPVCAALAPVDGEVEFFTNDVNSTASSTVNTYGTRSTVRGMTLASILSIHQLEHVDVCKVDCEGAEGESLSFEQLALAKPVVKQWLIECHNCPKSTYQDKMGWLSGIFCHLGYNIKTYGMTVEAEL